MLQDKLLVERIEIGMKAAVDKEARRHISTYPKVAVQWLNQALCFYQSLCWVDSEVLRNPRLRKAAKRYRQA